MFLKKFTTTPVMDVALLELNEENHETVVSQARVINQHEPQGTFERTLPEALQELLGRSTEYLTNSEVERLQEFLYNYQHVFSPSDGDLGTTHLPYLPVYKSTFSYLKIGPKNRPRLIHGSKFSTQAPVKYILHN